MRYYSVENLQYSLTSGIDTSHIHKNHQQLIYLFSRLYNVFTSSCAHVHIFLRPFINHIIFFLQLCLSFLSSFTNSFSPINPLIPSAQVSLGLPYTALFTHQWFYHMTYGFLNTWFTYLIWTVFSVVYSVFCIVL
jgi:hypothetical protein